nr:hypothetical protein NG677_04280 [Methylobacterium sp. OTU13CASTA1]
MADPKTVAKIKEFQTKANKIWSDGQAYYQKARADHTAAANKATSTGVKKSEEGKAEEAHRCAEYCRDKLG